MSFKVKESYGKIQDQEFHYKTHGMKCNCKKLMRSGLLRGLRHGCDKGKLNGKMNGDYVEMLNEMKMNMIEEVKRMLGLKCSPKALKIKVFLILESKRRHSIMFFWNSKRLMVQKD